MALYKKLFSGPFASCVHTFSEDLKKKNVCCVLSIGKKSHVFEKVLNRSNIFFIRIVSKRNLEKKIFVSFFLHVTYALSYMPGV